MGFADKIMNENDGRNHYKASNIILIIAALILIGEIIYNTINGGVFSLIISTVISILLLGILRFIVKCIDALVYKIRGRWSNKE